MYALETSADIHDEEVSQNRSSNDNNNNNKLTVTRTRTYFLLEKECYCLVSSLQYILVFLLSQQILPGNIQNKQESVFPQCHQLARY